MNLFFFIIMQVLRRAENKCLLLRIHSSDKFERSNAEEDYSTANFRGMKKSNCFDDIKYFTVQPSRNRTEALNENL